MAGFNPFKSKPPVVKPNRNPFELSFANNLTMEFGKLYPVLCKEVVPGDTFEIDTTFGLRFMPMYFPVQTRMRADLHFFYVRNRNLWSDWKDFIGRTKDGLVKPYLKITSDRARKELSTGSLADYLGVPTTVVGNVLPSWRSTLRSASPFLAKKDSSIREYKDDFASAAVSLNQLGWQKVNLGTYVDWVVRSQQLADGVRKLVYRSFNGVDMKLSQWNSLYDSSNSSVKNSHVSAFTMTTSPLPHQVTDDSTICLDTFDFAAVGTSFKCSVHIFTKDEDGEYICQASTEMDDVTFTVTNSLCKSPIFGKINVYPQASRVSTKVVTSSLPFPTVQKVTLSEFCNKYLEREQPLYIGISSTAVAEVMNKFNWQLSGEGYPYVSGLSVTNLTGAELFEADSVLNPFVSYSGAAPAQPLCAFPFRAYESIYNSFYRNIQVSPFKIGGTIEYNKFIPTDAGGADTHTYELHYRDWEDDFLTTCLPSPQQGIAPLVGAFQNKSQQGILKYIDSDGTSKQITIQANNSGDLTAVSVRDGDLPESTIDSLNSAIEFGISINDFRNVNALQRWLEINIRRGYRYKDQILSHFGVSVSYDACDMPEYIGGVSQDVNVSTISQSSNTEYGNLGDQAGMASCVGSSKHKVNKYFDEHGFVMAILSVSPIPSYSQLLPKMFTKTDVLDYYTPEFNHIGMQPVTYREVCPVQQYSNGGSLDDTFGYQRAWYDYLASVDEVHGQFRTTLRNYLVNRIFGVSPELGQEFLQIDPNQVNNIFNYTRTDDKIIGQLYFSITSIRPFSKFGVPRIE